MTKIFKKFKLSLLAAALGFTALGSAASAKSLKARYYSPFGTYIALGDSRATGLGFEGYNTENKVDGFLEKTEGSYTYQLASEWAPELPPRRYMPEGYSWTSFASNEFRMEDIYFELAGPKAEYDEYYKAVFDSANSEGLQKNKAYLKAVQDYIEEVEPRSAKREVENELTEYMRTAVEQAEYVTLDAGINAYTKFLLGKVTEFVKSDYVDEVGSILSDFGFNVEFGGKDSAQGLLDRMFGEGVVPLQKLYNIVFGAIYYASNETLNLDSLDNITGIPGIDKLNVAYLAEMLVYTFVSYCFYLNETTKLIMDLNPDVKLTVVGLSNPVEGMKVDIGPWTIPVGDIVGSFVEIANIYARVGALEAGHYYFVDPLFLDMERRIETLAAAEEKSDIAKDEREIIADVVDQICVEINKFAGVDVLDATAYTTNELFGSYTTGYSALNTYIGVVEDIIRGSKHNTFEYADIENIVRLYDLDLQSNQYNKILNEFDNASNDAIIYLVLRYVAANGAFNTFSNNSHTALATAIKGAVDYGKYSRQIILEFIAERVKEVVDFIIDKVIEARDAFIEWVEEEHYVEWYQANFDRVNNFVKAIFNNFNEVFDGLVNGSVEAFETEVDEILGFIQTGVDNAVSTIETAIDGVKDFVQGIEGIYDGFMHEVVNKIDELTSFIKIVAQCMRTHIKNTIEFAIYSAQHAVTLTLKYIAEVVIPCVREGFKFAVSEIEKAILFAMECVEWAPTYHHDKGFAELVKAYYDEQLTEKFTVALQNIIEYTRDHIEPVFAMANGMVEGGAFVIEEVFGLPKDAYTAILNSIFGVVDHIADRFWTAHGEDCVKLLNVFTKYFKEEVDQARKLVETVDTAIYNRLTFVYDMLEGFEQLGVDMTEAKAEEMHKKLHEVLAQINEILDFAGMTVETLIAPAAVQLYKKVIESIQVIFPHEYDLEDVVWDGDGSGKGTAHCKWCDWTEKVTASYVWDTTSGEDPSCTASVQLPYNNTVSKSDEFFTETVDATQVSYTRPNVYTGAKGTVTYEAEFSKNFETQYKTETTVGNTEVTYSWVTDPSSGDLNVTATTDVINGDTVLEDDWSVVGTVLDEDGNVDITANKDGTLNITVHFFDDLNDGEGDVEVFKPNTRQNVTFITNVTYQWSTDGHTCTATATNAICGYYYSETASLDEGTIVVKDGAFNAVFDFFDDNKCTEVKNVEQDEYHYTLNADGTCTATAVITAEGAEPYTITETTDVVEATVPEAVSFGGDNVVTHTATFTTADGRTHTYEEEVEIEVDYEESAFEFNADGTAKVSTVLTDEDGNTYTVEEDLAGVPFSFVSNNNGAIQAQGLEIEFDNKAVQSINDSTVLSVTASEDNSTYVLELTDKTGKTAEFEGEVTIAIPYTEDVPEGYVVKVYYKNGNELVDMNATLADGKLTFKTPHFSEYIVRVEKLPEPEKSGLGLWWILIAVLALICVSSLVYVFVIKPKSARKGATK